MVAFVNPFRAFIFAKIGSWMNDEVFLESLETHFSVSFFSGVIIAYFPSPGKG